MELRLLDLRTYDKTMIIKTVQYWPRISAVEQESPEADPHKIQSIRFGKLGQFNE